jgi:hypothetical protein
MEQFGSQWMDFYEIGHLNTSRKSVEKIQVSSASEKNKRYFVLRSMYIYDISLNSAYTEKYFRQKF